MYSIPRALIEVAPIHPWAVDHHQEDLSHTAIPRRPLDPCILVVIEKETWIEKEKWTRQENETRIRRRRREEAVGIEIHRYGLQAQDCRRRAINHMDWETLPPFQRLVWTVDPSCHPPRDHQAPTAKAQDLVVVQSRGQTTMP